MQTQESAGAGGRDVACSPTGPSSPPARASTISISAACMRTQKLGCSRGQGKEQQGAQEAVSGQRAGGAGGTLQAVLSMCACTPLKASLSACLREVCIDFDGALDCVRRRHADLQHRRR